jgi:hypothetical protein
MTTGTMGNSIFAEPCRSALQANELGNATLMVKQFDAATVENAEHF